MEQESLEDAVPVQHEMALAGPDTSALLAQSIIDTKIKPERESRPKRLVNRGVHRYGG